jgi:hypothetical protein
MPPDLVYYGTVDEYRAHYERCYCQSMIYTFDGIRVFFPKQQFDDAFFESVNRKKRDKSQFSQQRAERIDWIRAALMDRTAELYVGWDREKKKTDPNRRVTLIYGNYVVILNINPTRTKATFITAYVATAITIAKIRSGDRWV